MDKIEIEFDPSDNTLIIRFAEPADMAYLSPIEEETPGDMYFVKNEAGQVSGIECMFYHLAPGSLPVQFETLVLNLPEASH